MNYVILVHFFIKIYVFLFISSYYYVFLPFLLLSNEILSSFDYFFEQVYDLYKEPQRSVITMDTFKLTRRRMSDLLHSINSEKGISPKEILTITGAVKSINNIKAGAVASFSFPAIFDKLIKLNNNQGYVGLSINDIANLGEQIEYTSFSKTAVQNWVKRDAKDIIGKPAHGKKYSLEQAAIIFIVEDLKTTLDFESIRGLLQMIFNQPENRSDDIIDPLVFYKGYSSIFEELGSEDYQILFAHDKYKVIENLVDEKVNDFISETVSHLNDEHKLIVKHTMIIAIFSVRACYFHHLSKQYATATLLLQRN